MAYSWWPGFSSPNLPEVGSMKDSLPKTMRNRLLMAKVRWHVVWARRCPFASSNSHDSFSSLPTTPCLGSASFPCGLIQVLHPTLFSGVSNLCPLAFLLVVNLPPSNSVLLACIEHTIILSFGLVAKDLYTTRLVEFYRIGWRSDTVTIRISELRPIQWGGVWLCPMWIPSVVERTTTRSLLYVWSSNDVVKVNWEMLPNKH